MGINFPRVRYVVQYGPPTSIVDLMQQAGRGGRDGTQAHCVTYFTKCQLARCGKEVKSVVKSGECQRQALYSFFSDSVSPLCPGHLCCSICRQQCKCNTTDDKCNGILEVFATEPDEQEELPASEKTRKMTSTDTNDLLLALQELQTQYSASGALTIFEPTLSHGFNGQLINDLVKNAANIFSFDYLQNHFSVYSTKHVMDVLEVFQELFEDILDFEQQMEMLHLLNSEVTRAEKYLQVMKIDTYFDNVHVDISDDSDDEFLLSEFDFRF